MDNLANAWLAAVARKACPTTDTAAQRLSQHLKSVLHQPQAGEDCQLSIADAALCKRLRNHSRHCATQKGIDLAFEPKRRRQRWLIGGTENAAGCSVACQHFVIGLDTDRERQIRRRVFVRTADRGGIWQRRKSLQRRVHLHRRTFEQPAATRAEQSIAAKQGAARAGLRAVIRNVVEGMAGHRDDLKTLPQQFEFRAVTNLARHTGDSRSTPRRAIDIDVIARGQGWDTINMITMMMGQQYRSELQTATLYFRQDWDGFTGINNQRIAAVVEHPDVVIRKRRQTGNVEHILSGIYSQR